ncbi:hypothetical protein ACMV5I_29435, partial [Serratia sp. T13T92]|uniref:hypothetical protein n=1 Tax=Serratia sp. T13T92 TaxID=3397496 RepID=UPI0039E000FD
RAYMDAPDNASVFLKKVNRYCRHIFGFFLGLYDPNHDEIRQVSAYHPYGPGCPCAIRHVSPAVLPVSPSS